MKAGLLSVVGLSALAVAQIRNDHQRFHKKHIQQREYKVEYQTDHVTVYAPAATVYVDSNGKPCDVNGQPLAPAPAPAAVETPAPKAPTYNPTPQPAAPAPKPVAPAPQPAAPAPQPAAPAPKAPTYNPTPKPAPAPEPAAPAPKPAAPAPKPSAPSYGPSPAPSSGGSSGLGITYTVYQPDGKPCKDQSQINDDIAKIFQSGDYSFLRTYGVDCQQSSKVRNAIKNSGKDTKILLTIMSISDIEAECQQLVADMGGDWSGIDTIAIGNELVNTRQASPAQIKAAIATAKGCLTGYNGKIITIDTFTAIINNPELCDVGGDYIGANCHAFFDPATVASEAGNFVLEQAQKVSQVCGGQKVVITESGWPNQGAPNNLAVPSMENQQAAISSLKSKFTDNLFLFSAFNELWKQDTGDTFGCEKYWGIIH